MTPLGNTSTSLAGVHAHPQIETFKNLTPETYLNLNSEERSSLEGLYNEISDLSAWTFPQFLRPFRIYQQIMEMQRTEALSQSSTLAKKTEIKDLTRSDLQGFAEKARSDLSGPFHPLRKRSDYTSCLPPGNYSSSSTRFPSRLHCCDPNLEMTEDWDAPTKEDKRLLAYAKKLDHDPSLELDRLRISDRGLGSKRKFSIIDEDSAPTAKKGRISPCNSEGDRGIAPDPQEMDIVDAAPPFELDLEGLKSYDPVMKDEALRRIKNFAATFNPKNPTTLDLRDLRLYSLPHYFYTEPMFANTQIDGNALIPRELKVSVVKNVELFLKIFRMHTSPSAHPSREAVLHLHDLPLTLITSYVGTPETSSVCKIWEYSYLMGESRKDYYSKHPDLSKYKISCLKKEIPTNDLEVIAIVKKIKSNKLNLSKAFIRIYNGLMRLQSSLNTSQYIQIKHALADFNRAQSIAEKASILRTLLNSHESLCLRVEELELQSLELTELPPEIRLFKNLKSLNLTNNKLKELPGWLNELTQLRSIFLGRNLLTELSSDLSSLQQLELLRLENNHLKEIPACVFTFKSLRDLSLSGNQLTVLPAEIGVLQGLTELRLDNNQLSSLPSEMGALRQLMRLYLSSNKLLSLPEEFSYLTGLYSLDASKNQLKEFPSLLEGALPVLRSLLLGDNRFSTFPVGVTSLASLTDLELSNNKLSRFPAEIEKLTQLRRLALHDNEITLDPDSLPTCATTNPRLQVDLRKNPIPDGIQQLVRETYPPYSYLNYGGAIYFKDEDYPPPPSFLSSSQEE